MYNPEQQNKPEGRFFLAIAMTFGFLFVWYNFMAPKPKPLPKEKVEEQNVATQSPVVSPSVSNAAPVLSGPGSNPNAQQAMPVQIPVPTIENYEKKVETDNHVLTFSNQGGGLIKAISKKHKKTKKSEEGVTLLSSTQNYQPTSWLFEINGVQVDTSSLAFEVSDELENNTISFKQTIAEGLSLEKIFVWSDAGQFISQNVRLDNSSAQAYVIKPVFRMAGQEHQQAEKKRSFFFAPQLNKLSGLAYIGDNVKRWPVEKFGTKEKPSKVPGGAIEWFGFDQQYFLFSALPKEGRWESLSVNKAQGTSEGTLSAQYPAWNLAPGQQKSYALDIYAGPKDIKVLKLTKPGLEQAIDLGSWLGVIARPILSLLKFLYSVVPNYGVAIILLTVLVRLLMFPLTQVQAKSMKKMSLHKPQMDALKEQYKDNREEHSRALMNYMRENKINPASGCFLLILQMPVFFALYRVLYNSIELRHAPFFAWIQDLSAHDPFFVLPVLLGISMFFQQKLTPTAGVDPAQQAMMKFIPIIFTVFMVFLPAGLNIYILISTLWGVGQQYWIQKSVKSVAV